MVDYAILANPPYSGTKQKIPSVTLPAQAGIYKAAKYSMKKIVDKHYDPGSMVHPLYGRGQPDVVNF